MTVSEPGCTLLTLVLMIIPATIGLYSTTHLDFSVADVLGITVFISVIAMIWTPLQPVIQRRIGTSNLQMLIVSVILAFISPLMGCSSVFWPGLGIRNKWQLYVATFGYSLVSRHTICRILLNRPSGNWTVYDLLASPGL